MRHFKRKDLKIGCVGILLLLVLQPYCRAGFFLKNNNSAHLNNNAIWIEPGSSSIISFYDATHSHNLKRFSKDFLSDDESTKTGEYTHNRKRSFYIDLKYQTGEIDAYGLGLGIMINNFMIGLQYGQSSEIYSNDLFIDSDQDYEIKFHDLSAGISYDIILFQVNRFGAFLSPGINFGAEIVKNDNLLNSEEIDYLMNYLLKPEVKVGLFISGIEIYAGMNYYYWLSSAMNSKRVGLYDAETEDPLKWPEELFPDRKGLNLLFGLRLKF